MTVTSETVDVEGTPVFKSRKVKGKDIGNHAAKERKVAKRTPKAMAMREEVTTETIGETLGEVFSPPAVTHKTSLYKQFCKEQAALRRDA